MTNTNETPETPSILMFGDKPIRVVTFEDGGVPHFSLLDICAAMGKRSFVASAVDRAPFPSHGKRHTDTINAEAPHGATVLTPVGVWFFTDMVDARRGERLAAFVKREANKLYPDPKVGDPRMFLTLCDDAELPPRPTKYSGRRAEWYALKGSAEYFDGIAARSQAREERFFRAQSASAALDRSLRSLEKEMRAEWKAGK